MFFQTLIITIFTILAGLIATLVALVVRVFLKLMEEMLNLKIKIEPEKKEP
jgi:hypothetical protein